MIDSLNGGLLESDTIVTTKNFSYPHSINIFNIALCV